MIAIDLSPLLYDPLRGVATALTHLLEGLGRIDRGELELVGLLPAPPDPASPLLTSALAGVSTVVAARAPHAEPVRRARRRLAALAQSCGARVVLSPWAAFPSTDLPRVTWIHEVPFARLGPLEGRLRTLRHWRALGLAVERSAALVVPSEAVRADLLRLHPEAEARTHVVPHGFDPRPWARPAPSHDEPPYVLLVGSGRGAGGAGKKGVDVFARAFASGGLGGLRAVLVGAAPGLPPGLEVRPALSGPDLVRIVAHARVLVVPSRSEGFGYPMLEAFAAGVPVVASAAGALPEVSGGAALLVPPGDPDALAEAVRRAAGDDALRRRLIDAGRLRARQLPVEACATGWLRVLCAAGGLPWPG